MGSVKTSHEFNRANRPRYTPIAHAPWSRDHHDLAAPGLDPGRERSFAEPRRQAVQREAKGEERAVHRQQRVGVSVRLHSLHVIDEVHYISDDVRGIW